MNEQLDLPGKPAIIETNTNARLDGLKRVHANGSFFWMARDLMPVLGYATWENFKKAIIRAKSSCESSGGNCEDHFRDTTKKVSIGSGAEVAREDCFLSKYACYLVAMNGDTRKPVIGAAQAYFVVQTSKQERFDDLVEAEKRIEFRDRVASHNRELNSAARESGVLSNNFGLFHDAGYRGLYEMSLREIKANKGIPEKDALLDCAGRVELAANDFRITQTEQKLRSEKIQGEQTAINTHFAIGQQVRETIKKIGGPTPEKLPAETHIKKLKSALKKTKKLKAQG
jgi:DNA-damage-inducible protein D